MATSIFEQGRNLFFLIQIGLVAIGMYWLAANDVAGGFQYILMWLVSVALLTIIFYIINENVLIREKKFIKPPITISMRKAIIWYFVAWLLPIGVKLIGFLIKIPQFSTTTIMYPFSSTPLTLSIAQKFSAAELATQPFWNWFTSVFTAGTFEEFTWQYPLMGFGFLIGVFVLLCFNKFTNGKSRGSTIFYYIVAFAVVFATFMIVHQLNASYVGIMFLIAGLFRIAMNSTVHIIGLPIMFAIGFHQSNNNIWFIENLGMSQFLEAILTIPGLIIVFLIFIAPMIYVLTNKTDA